MSRETAQVPTPQQIRHHVHRMWDAVAESWGEHAEHVEQRSQPVTRLMLDAVAPAPGDEVLELACGTGGLGLAIADRVGPGGRVVLSDTAPQMVAIAAARAARRMDRGATTAAVTAREIDMEQIDLPDASFDIIVCREGLMFALDPAAATREIARVLRPGGRVAVAVWGPRNLNPWLGALADAVQEHIGSPVPPAGMPGPFALGADGALERALAAAALHDIRVTEAAVPTHDASFEDYWDLRTDLAGPLMRILEAQPPKDLAAIREKVRDRLARYQTPDGLRIPGLAYIGSAHRPDQGRRAMGTV